MVDNPNATGHYTSAKITRPGTPTVTRHSSTARAVPRQDGYQYDSIIMDNRNDDISAGEKSILTPNIRYKHPKKRPDKAS